jgi:hypothetical protein
MLDAIDLSLLHRCVPAAYRWEPKAVLTDVTDAA